MNDKYDIVKDDIIQMYELALAFEKKKTRILNKQIRIMKQTDAAEEERKSNDLMKEFDAAIKEELDTKRLQSFAYETDIM